MKVWTRVAENLVRHQGGMIYLRAKVDGKVIRVSLETVDLRIAKLKRDDRLERMRRAAATAAESKAIRTLGDAVDAVEKRMLSQPQHKARTTDYYRSVLKTLRETLPLTIHARQWTRADAQAWWKDIAERYSACRANNALSMLKRVGAAMKESGVRHDNPASLLRRMKIPEPVHNVASKAEIDRIVESVRGQKKAHSEEAANFIAFLGFAGCRHGQAKALRWEHVEEDWIIFPGGGDGTKGAKTRRLPISKHLRDLLERMRGGEDKAGKLFAIGTPRDALNNATKRLGLHHLRIHDLRHSFSTYALECGVDIPTVAAWLGHKDGGALLLRTYSHLRDDHSKQSAAKL